MTVRWDGTGQAICSGNADPTRTATIAGPYCSAPQVAGIIAFFALEPPIVPVLTSAPVLGTYTTLFTLTGANMNTTADQQWTQAFAFSTYIPLLVVTRNASLSLTTVAGGIYTAAGKSGTALVVAAQIYSGLSDSSKTINPWLAVPAQQPITATPPYLSLTTAQGAAATADFTIMGLAG